MLISEFWAAVDRVYGPVLGRSLIQDLYLTALCSTAVQALESGADPDRVWRVLVDETGRDEDARWVHRRPDKKKPS